jgi:hypothetical protein
LKIQVNQQSIQMKRIKTKQENEETDRNEINIKTCTTLQQNSKLVKGLKNTTKMNKKGMKIGKLNFDARNKRREKSDGKSENDTEKIDSCRNPLTFSEISNTTRTTRKLIQISTYKYKEVAHELAEKISINPYR